VIARRVGLVAAMVMRLASGFTSKVRPPSLLMAMRPSAPARTTPSGISAAPCSEPV
jgi:hypothetical protein